MTDREIRRELFRKYPKTEKEKQGCKEELARMTALRDMYKERLCGQTTNSKA